MLHRAGVREITPLQECDQRSESTKDVLGSPKKRIWVKKSDKYVTAINSQ